MLAPSLLLHPEARPLRRAKKNQLFLLSVKMVYIKAMWSPIWGIHILNITLSILIYNDLTILGEIREEKRREGGRKGGGKGGGRE